MRGIIDGLVDLAADGDIREGHALGRGGVLAVEVIDIEDELERLSGGHELVGDGIAMVALARAVVGINLIAQGRYSGFQGCLGSGAGLDIDIEVAAIGTAFRRVELYDGGLKGVPALRRDAVADRMACSLGAHPRGGREHHEHRVVVHGSVAMFCVGIGGDLHARRSEVSAQHKRGGESVGSALGEGVDSEVVLVAHGPHDVGVVCKKSLRQSKSQQQEKGNYFAHDVVVS